MDKKLCDRAKASRPVGCPIFPHRSGRWARKVQGGRFAYLGKVLPDGDYGLASAMERWLREKDFLIAGRLPPSTADGLTVAGLCNSFLTSKLRAFQAGQIVERTFMDLHGVCDLLVGIFGRERPVASLTVADFDEARGKLPATWGPIRTGAIIAKAKSVFKFGLDSGLLDRPVKTGTVFRPPSNRILRLARAARGERLFRPEELRAVIDAAPLQLKAMVLLGANCGFGPTDIGRLPIAALDLQSQWVTFARPKTGIMRRCPLWHETVAALEAVLKSRREPAVESARGLVFITRTGKAWIDGKGRNSVGHELAKVLRAVGLGDRDLGHYRLRHLLQSVGEEAGDAAAVSHIMGHVAAANDMAAVYRGKISDDRLRRVADHVRQWLFGGPAPEPQPAIEARRPTPRLTRDKQEVPSWEAEQGPDGVWRVKQ